MVGRQSFSFLGRYISRGYVKLPREYAKIKGVFIDSPQKKYVNIPSEKYIYVHIYVCICVYTYLCKMDERRSYASLSKKWMSTGIVLACHKNG